jgi:carboxyl-terminal processing protease
LAHRSAIAILAFALTCVPFAAPACYAQQQTALNKDEMYQVSGMLRDAHDEVKKNYYDPKLHGVDWDARYQQYSAKLDKAHNLGEGFRVVAAFLSGLKDSHTFFLPPQRDTRYEYGYRLELVGDNCFVTQVRPGTDAASKMHIGDQVVQMNGYNCNREDSFDLRYYFNLLATQKSAQFELQSPRGEQRQAAVNFLIQVGKPVLELYSADDYYDAVRREEGESHTVRSRVVEEGDVAIWKFRLFGMETYAIEKAIATARKHNTLILDLRGNPGGRIDTLEQVIGSLFDHDIKIGDQMGRKNSKPVIAKHEGKSFDGKLIVLVDGGSASAAEILGRVVQLEHRGTVIGDRTAGAVMEARDYQDQQGADFKIFYGFSVTVADLIMSDGKSLEKTGVKPDEQVLPTGADLAAGRDPVLARAAELAGVKLDAVAAGKLFPFEWAPL